MFSLKSAAFGAATLVLLSGSIAVAQQSADDPRINKVQTAKANPITPSTTPSSKMTIDQVGNLIKSLGYQFKTVTRQNGTVVHELDVVHQGKTVFVDISLSKDGSKVWLTGLMNQLQSGQTIPSNILQKMLENNLTLGTTFFAIGTNGTIWLQSPLDNRSLTPDELRRQVDLFAQLVNQTENLWNHNRWNAQVGQ